MKSIFYVEGIFIFSIMRVSALGNRGSNETFALESAPRKTIMERVILKKKRNTKLYT